jgi:TorA maturation chaperone TorD
VTESNKIDWQETLTGEMLLLNLLGRIVYNYPENEERIWLESLIAEDVFSEAPFAGEKEETKSGLELFRKWGENGLTNEAFERLQADYTRLFIGPDKVIAAPWESVYLDEERLTFQEQTLDVRYWYRRFGLEADRIHREPDDHIGLELMFLARLATLGIQALDQQGNARFDELLDAQREFLKKHLGAWALTWCGLVEKNARTDFYKGLSHLTRGALSAMSEVLDVKLGKDGVH